MTEDILDLVAHFVRYGTYNTNKNYTYFVRVPSTYLLAWCFQVDVIRRTYILGSVSCVAGGEERAPGKGAKLKLCVCVRAALVSRCYSSTWYLVCVLL